MIGDLTSMGWLLSLCMGQKQIPEEPFSEEVLFSALLELNGDKA